MELHFEGFSKLLFRVLFFIAVEDISVRFVGSLEDTLFFVILRLFEGNKGLSESDSVLMSSKLGKELLLIGPEVKDKASEIC